MKNSIIIPEAKAKMDFFYQLDPRTKGFSFFFFMATVVFTPIACKWKFLFYFTMVVVLSVLIRIPLKKLLSRIAFLLPLLIFLGMTLIFWGKDPYARKIHIMVTIFLKSGLIFAFFSLLALTTEFHSLIKGLERMKIPRTIISILSFYYRYLFLFLQDARRFKWAWVSRHIGGKRKLRTIFQLFRIIPHFFIRVFDRSIKIYAAMLSRGFDKKMPSLNSLHFRKKDYIFGVGFNLLLLTIVILP
ncbi:MAG: hypothetical protein KAT17_06395 [Candidatus Aminicenantes bacterium]|nr:hypothetical protein [Candidatus Aminicenantes bacterium]